ncbi:MAG: hypothetical protein QG657_1341, partial [Acidobacteriota bacterium]|nr:hypothetical protein [Acidobacteriota bacterium]
MLQIVQLRWRVEWPKEGKICGEEVMKIESEKFKRREEKLLLMHKVGAELLSTANIEKVLTKITETAIDITEAEEAALFLKSENGDKLFLRALKKVDKENAEALNIDVTDFMEYPPKDRLQSIKLSNREIEKATGKFPKYLINVPIKSTMGEVGLLCVYNFKLEKQFDEEDEELLTILANYTSSAVKNKKLVDDAFQEAEMLSGLFNVSQSMLSEVDLHKLLGIIADNALEVLGADIVVLYEYSKEKDDVEIPPIFRGKNIKEPKRLSERGKTHRESVVFKLLKSGTSFYASNAREDWKSLFLSDEKEDDLEDHFISREKIISSAGIPLYINGEPVGVLFINYRTYCAFTPQLRTTIKQFANEAALAIRNAKIFSQRDRYINELSVLNKIVQEISSTVTLNIDEILKLIFAQTGRLMDVRNFFAALYDKEKDTVSFEFAVENGILQEMGVGQWTPRKAGNGLTEYVIHTQEALLIQKDIYDWLELHGVCPLGNPSKSWLGAPMMLKNEVLGVIVIQNTWEENAYDEGHKKILETIASQAAIAIDKARLFQDYQKQ